MAKRLIVGGLTPGYKPFAAGSRMADEPRLENDVRAFRDRLGWSQDELRGGRACRELGSARSRPAGWCPRRGPPWRWLGHSAAPWRTCSGCHASSRRRRRDGSAWAWAATHGRCRYWRAEVNGITRAYPVEFSPLGCCPMMGRSRTAPFATTRGLRRRRPLSSHAATRPSV